MRIDTDKNSIGKEQNTHIKMDVHNCNQINYKRKHGRHKSVKKKIQLRKEFTDDYQSICQNKFSFRDLPSNLLDVQYLIHNDWYMK